MEYLRANCSRAAMTLNQARDFAQNIRSGPTLPILLMNSIARLGTIGIPFHIKLPSMPLIMVPTPQMIMERQGNSCSCGETI